MHFEIFSTHCFGRSRPFGDADVGRPRHFYLPSRRTATSHCSALAAAFLSLGLYWHFLDGGVDELREALLWEYATFEEPQVGANSGNEVCTGFANQDRKCDDTHVCRVGEEVVGFEEYHYARDACDGAPVLGVSI